VLLANGLLRTPYAKTTYGMLRGPSRYRIAAVVDADAAGGDAGEILDGRSRGIPIVASLNDAVEELGGPPDVCVVGVATVGGVLPEAIRQDLHQAAGLGITLVNGMHQLLADDSKLLAHCTNSGAKIIDLRKPRSTDQMAFWSGDVLTLRSLRVAVLGIDCAVGKRTTSCLLRDGCDRVGIRASLVYTGQTGWLQGFDHGFVLDATPNDFVCGELERALIACENDCDPEVILIEGQSGLRNPSGPCGSELILGGAVAGVILQHVPGRRFFEGFESRGLRIPTVDSEIALIESLGAPVWAVTINPEGLEADAVAQVEAHLRQRLSIPVVDPLVDGVNEVVQVIESKLRRENS